MIIIWLPLRKMLDQTWMKTLLTMESIPISLFETTINSNIFNAFELHGITKNNSLYFMLQYMFQKFEFGSKIKGFEPGKYQNLSLNI